MGHGIAHRCIVLAMMAQQTSSFIGIFLQYAEHDDISTPGSPRVAQFGVAQRDAIPVKRASARRCCFRGGMPKHSALW